MEVYKSFPKASLSCGGKNIDCDSRYLFNHLRNEGNVIGKRHVGAFRREFAVGTWKNGYFETSRILGIIHRMQRCAMGVSSDEHGLFRENGNGEDADVLYVVGENVVDSFTKDDFIDICESFPSRQARIDTGFHKWQQVRERMLWSNTASLNSVDTSLCSIDWCGTMSNSATVFYANLDSAAEWIRGAKRYRVREYGRYDDVLADCVEPALAGGEKVSVSVDGNGRMSFTVDGSHHDGGVYMPYAEPFFSYWWELRDSGTLGYSIRSEEECRRFVMSFSRMDDRERDFEFEARALLMVQCEGSGEIGFRI